MDIYLDDYARQVEALLKTQFTTSNFNRLKPMLATYDNLFKKIVNLKSQIYKDEPMRRWVNDAGETLEQNQDYSDLISNSNLNSELLTVERFANANNVSFARIVVRDGKLEYDAVQGECVQVEQDDDDPMRINALVFEIQKTNTRDNHRRTVHIWTNGKSHNFDNGEDGKGTMTVIKNFAREGQEEMVVSPNPYQDPFMNGPGSGIIPFVKYQTVRGVDYWAETMGEDLRSGTLQVNVNQTHINNLIKFGGYRQIVVVGSYDETKMSQAQSDVGTVIGVVPIPGVTGVGASALDHTKNPNELIDANEKIAAKIAANNGVSFNADAIESRQRQTAEALTINRSQLIELREERIPMFRLSERELAIKTIIIANTPTNQSGLGLRIPMDDNWSFMIDYPEQRIVSNSKEEQEVDLLDIANGMNNAINYVMKRNPDLMTDEQAEAFLKKNAEINAEFTIASKEPEGDDEIVTASIRRLNTEEVPEGTNG